MTVLHNDLSLGLLIKRELEQRGWSQSRLAQEAQVSAPAVSKVVRGIHTPERKTLVAIADALGLDVERLARLAGGEDPLFAAKGHGDEHVWGTRTHLEQLHRIAELPPGDPRLLDVVSTEAQNNPNFYRALRAFVSGWIQE